MNNNEHNIPIGIAIEDGDIMVTCGMVSGEPPYSNGLYVTDANIAMKTLPRIIQRMIYRYAKWRLSK